MIDQAQQRCTAFKGMERIASGRLSEVVRRAKETIDRGETEPVLIFDDATSEPVEVDFRGSVHDVLARLAERDARAVSTGAGQDSPVPARRGRGRPRLGVVGREVTLLPRHWDWLSSQPGGASVTLRKLVDEARRNRRGADRIRQAQESAYRFMTTIAGNLPGYEEAIRALFARDAARFEETILPWPGDVRDHARALASAAFKGQREDAAG